MLETYAYKYIDSGRLIFVPTADARRFGQWLHRRILKQHWTRPDYFYHFNDGGHVAAARVHLPSKFFVRLDLARFFDSISRGRVHRSLRRIGFKHGSAWDAACQSTVSKDRPGYSLPFGFVQSQVLASLALTTSALGAALLGLHNRAVRLSVYMDDFILSGDDFGELSDARDSLAAAAEVSGFQFNPAKSTGPSAALEVFNLNLCHGHLAVTATRRPGFRGPCSRLRVSGRDPNGRRHLGLRTPLRLARGPGSARSPVTFSRKINPSARNWSLFGYPLRVPGH